MSDATMIQPSPAPPTGSPALPRLTSGVWQVAPHMTDYRAEWLDEMYVERITWAEDAPSVQLNGADVAGPGFVWFRFWLPEPNQVVEKYFSADTQPVGLYVPLCTPLERTATGYEANSLILSIWLPADGRVLVMDETEYEAAVASGRINPAQAEFAESHIRILTGGVAARTFPPALVRNFELAK